MPLCLPSALHGVSEWRPPAAVRPHKEDDGVWPSEAPQSRAGPPSCLLLLLPQEQQQKQQQQQKRLSQPLTCNLGQGSAVTMIFIMVLSVSLYFLTLQERWTLTDCISPLPCSAVSCLKPVFLSVMNPQAMFSSVKCFGVLNHSTDYYLFVIVI